MWAIGCVAYILACNMNAFLVNTDTKSQLKGYEQRVLSELVAKKRNKLIKKAMDRKWKENKDLPGKSETRVRAEVLDHWE